MALLGAVIKRRVGGLEKQKKVLEELVTQRTQEITRKNEELARLSITDPLTGLKNRRYLEEKLKEDISLIERQLYVQKRFPYKKSQPLPFILGVFMVDIDHFKEVNDTYGHSAGDRVLVEIANLLKEMLRNSDTVTRWGGEEFLIITRQNEIESSLALAERLRKRIDASGASSTT